MRKRLLIFMAALLTIAQGAWAQTEVSSESALNEALNSEGPISIKLTADITLEQRVHIVAGKTVTLDLNGHTLQRNQEGYHWYFMVIHNYGTLTINDSSGNNSGRITGGHAYGGGGIYCEPGSKLTFNGGTIIGNSVRNDPDGGAGWGGGVLVNDNAEATFNGGMILGNGAPLGGGIYNFGTLTIGNIVISGNTGNDGGAIFNRGTLNITAGSITDNLVNVHGGAGITNYGTINMTGGSITKNRSAKAGGGIWQGGTMNVQGNPVISDNTSNVHGSEDVYVSNPITVTGAFTQGAHIGVYPCTLNFVMTSGYGTHNAGTNPEQYFFSNIPYYAISANSSGEAILAVNSASKQRYITDVMVVGADSNDELLKLCEEYAQEGWTQLPTDLNEGAGGQYVYLLYKTGTDPERAIKDLYLRCGTGFGSDNRPETLTHEGCTYTIAAYDGDNHIKSNKGDLNSGATGSEDINLYYTREGSSAPLTRLWFDGEEAGCVGRNGTTTACDLNKGAGGDFVFLHISRELSPEAFGGGTGSADDPYIIGTTAHWKELAAKVGLGETYVGRYFFMTGHVDADGMQVGGNFKGTFDGAGRTLTFNAGSEASPRNQECVAPFYSLQGAMIKNLRVEGDIYTSRQYAAGVAAQVSGAESTILDNIVSAVKIHSTVVGDGTHGGLIAVNSARLEINNSRFEGSLLGPQTRCCAGMVGWTTGQVLFYNCIVAPAEISLDLSWSMFEILNATLSESGYGNFSRAFARNPVNSHSIFATKYPEPVFTKCYFTQQFGDPYVLGPQGKQLFSDVAVPTGCSVSIVEEPLVTVHGKNWYPTGTHIITQGNMPVFGYWKETNGAFISDPCAQSGWHLIQDVNSPILGLYNDPIRPEPEADYDIFGTKYIWLSRHDYHLYVSNEWLNENYPSWHFEDNDADANMVLTIDGEDCKATMAIWHFESDYVDGNTAYVMNDLVGNWYGHTHLIGISPRAFGASTALKYVRFMDSDAYLYNQNNKLKLFIDKEAFLDCPNLEQLQIVQYTTEGTNHYEALSPDQITYIGPNAFTNVSPNFTISVHRSQYQNFMASETFKPWRSKIVAHEFDGVDFDEAGVKYHVYKDAEERDKLQSDAEGKAEMMETLKWWNSEYQNFNAASLLTTNDDKDNVYYCSIVGVDDEDIDKEGGVMRIYNDPGDTYTYKTLQLGRNAIRGNSHVKYIEFWQTAGDAENSYSDLKMVIPNGALGGMSNLKELRLFYYEQDGKDHWTALGPKDIIPGNNIFGLPSFTEEGTYNNMKAGVPDDFKIVVSSDRFAEFANDPNWQPYIGMMECRDDPNNQGLSAFTEGGVTYDYVTAPGGIVQTTQVVSQDISWYTLPRILGEVAMWVVPAVIVGHAAATAASSTGAAAAAAAGEKAAYLGGELAANTTANLASQSTLKATWGILGNGLTKTVGQAVSVEMVTLEVLENVFVEVAVEVVTKAGHLALTAGGVAVIMGATALSGATASSLGFNLSENKGKMEVLKRLGVIQGDKFVCTESQLRNMSNADFLTFSQTLYNAIGVSCEVARRNEEELLNRLNEAMSLVTDAWNGPAVKQAGLNALTAGLIAKEAWGGTGSYNAEKFNKGMREQIRANLGMSTMMGGGYVFSHPQKNIVHHTYVKSFNGDFFGNCTIYVGHDNDGDANTSSRVTTFAKNAFTNRTDLQKVRFHENTGGATSQNSSSFICAIPDYAFKGCTNLKEFNLILQTEENGEYGLGPENFILAGDSIFCDVDTLNFHIIIDEGRKDDFLASESWKQYERFFQYREAVPKNGSRLNNYGAWYAYVYEENSIRKESAKDGHTIQHVLVNNPDNDFLDGHNGALKITVDIGATYNYQTDYVRGGAFRGNSHVKYVNFTDLDAGHDCYSDFQIELKDYSFANCSNLKYFDPLYLVTDGDNHIKPLTPEMLKIGKGVFDNTNAKIRMMPLQVKPFESDENWSAYKDRFLPCIIQPGDEYVRKALEDIRYHDYAATVTDTRNWDEYIDLSRISDEKGFGWIGEQFRNNDDIRSFGDFQYFEGIGLDYIGTSWFESCEKLSNISLPNSARRIEARAFAFCPRLRSITLPTQVAEIQNDVFAGCSNLNTIIVPSGKPATLKGVNQFEKNSGLKIYVPDSVVTLYKQQWTEYQDYIVGMSKYPYSKVVTVTGVGQLASKLGLHVVEDNALGYNTEVRWLEGPYTMYDSLTVIGPLNGYDLAVIRYMAGADAWNSDPTDGKLRYLNLWNAQLKKDTRWSYNCDGEDEYTDADNKVGDYLFDNCTSIETVIFPKSVTYIGENIFEMATGLKRVAIGRNTTEVECDILQDLDDYGGIDELVFLTNQHVTSDYSDPWEAPIKNVYVPKSQFAEYLNDDKLSRRAQSISTVFDNDHIAFTLAEKGGIFFPSEVRSLETLKSGIFNFNDELVDFSEFEKFYSLKVIGEDAFLGDNKLKTITLPSSVEYIHKDAFYGCTKLDSIRVRCDSIFYLERDAFVSLPSNFRIYVPKANIATYQERWSQYKDHIFVDEAEYSNDPIITVTLTEPNTLHEKLGLQVELSSKLHWLEGVSGDYSHIKKLKVIGPISGTDFELMRYLAGYTLWTKETNYFGQLEYLDLYDAQIRKTDNDGSEETDGGVVRQDAEMYDNVMHKHALKRAAKLKTLILPKTCKEIEKRAFLQCDNLETVVIGDDTEEIDWTCFDDCSQLAYTYFLCTKKPKITIDSRYWFDNDYSPTCDAMYVRPSLYRDYLDDTDYTEEHGSVKYTNLISKGAFSDDEAFCAFGQHAVSSLNDLVTVKAVDGWFDNHHAIKDLTSLRYTKVGRLKKNDFGKLTQLERLAVPMNTDSIEADAFKNAPNLRFVDFLAVEPTLVEKLKDGGLADLGIDLQKTLAYVPLTYGTTEETNVVFGSEGSGLMAHNYRLYDGWDYTVPYAFQTQTVENSRTLPKSDAPYTVCVPYTMEVPYGCKAYTLSDREGNQLVFTEIEGQMEAMQPYLVKVFAEGLDAENPAAKLSSTIAQEIPSSGGNTFGQQVDGYGYSLRGTFDMIDNQTAHELNAYVLKSDGKWYLVGNDTEAHRKAYIPPYRAFLLLNGGHRAPSLDMELEDNPTAIEEPEIETIKTVDRDGTEQIFDLSGRRLQRIPDTGIYILNGKKYVRK